MSKLFIYELDPTGGTCGFPAPIPGQSSVNSLRNELIRRSRIVKDLRNKLKLDVERILLKSVSFLKDETVKDLLKNEGIKSFPVFIYEKKIIHYGDFPDTEIINKKLNLNKK